jgi:hypothetical protein
VEATVAASPLQATYGTLIDRDSAREQLARKLDAAAAAQAKADAKAQAAAQKEYERILKTTSPTRTTRRTTSTPAPTVLEQVLGSKATRDILTGVVEGIFGTRRRR